ncbi:MAG: signal transduction protein [Sphingomonadales bacterium]|nr:MAG: signal transduction protein [Sphingomonadales bacterium]TNF03266.1 MAG: signal transduction protein [Sphingomonadales bacterium]
MNRYLMFALMLPVSGLGGAAFAQPQQQVDPARFADRIMEADANRDGKVSRAELTAYRKQQWARIDRNGDGYFSKDDLPRFAQGKWETGRPAEVRRLYDSNGDGRVSQAEFVNGPTVAFDMADANRDNIVTRDELDSAIAMTRAKRAGG